MSAPHEGDKSAAFTGLILGGIGIFVLCFAIVRITNAAYAGKSHGEGAAPAAAHGSPPPVGAPAGGGDPAKH
ncbi:MAG: hypothetical protein JWL60_1366 [Gemmatimonadetes bacterium]|jgi:hypothetical protein|nr:hypothetical protein [Gemmatimonadota bacterium]